MKTLLKTAADCEKAQPGRHACGSGLFLQVTEDQAGNKARSWLFRYRVNGRDKSMGLGAYDDLSLIAALAAIEQAHILIAKGEDPKVERKKADAPAALRKVVTFAQVADEFFRDKKEAELSKDSRCGGQWFRQLELHIFPVLGDIPVADIDVSAVEKCLRPLWRASDPDVFKKPKKERQPGALTAAVLARRIARILGYAMAKEYRPKGPNPAAWRDNLQDLLPDPTKVAGPKQRRRALPLDQVRSVLDQVREYPFLGCRALELLALTAVRHSEATGATWGEIDLANKLWSIPVLRTKMGKITPDRFSFCGDVFRIPLSEQACAILREIKGDDEPAKGVLVFVGKDGAKVTTLRTDLHRIAPNVDVHGFRTSFRTWGAGKYPPEVLEFCLAHIVGNAAERAYQRSDYLEQRRPIMQAWADFCCQPPAEVISIDSRKVA
jgi:integrase